MKLAGVVTLYHPPINIFNNIKTYLDYVDILYVLDNTENPDSTISMVLSDNKKIIYKSFNNNMGIAFAINYALKMARDFDFLLTMDQDSQFFPHMMEEYKKAIKEYENKTPNKVAVYAVNFDQRIDPVIPGYKRIKTAITSGSIISVRIASEMCGFDEKLFIDEVDNEFCYRATSSGYKIIEFPSILLKHSLGHQTFHTILGFHYNTFNHNALRKYYMFRNKIYILKKYPDVKIIYLQKLVKDLIKVILAENDKIHKLYYIFKGIRDGLVNRMGKFQEL